MITKGRPKSKNIKDRRKAPLHNPDILFNMPVEKYVRIRAEENRARKAGGSKGRRTGSNKTRTGGGF